MKVVYVTYYFAQKQQWKTDHESGVSNILLVASRKNNIFYQTKQKPAYTIWHADIVL